MYTDDDLYDSIFEELLNEQWLVDRLNQQRKEQETQDE